MRTRWELATLAGRLRNLEAERDDLRPGRPRWNATAT